MDTDAGANLDRKGRIPFPPCASGVEGSPGKPDTRDSTSSSDGFEGVRRAAPRDYQAQSRLVSVTEGRGETPLRPSFPASTGSSSGCGGRAVSRRDEASVAASGEGTEGPAREGSESRCGRGGVRRDARDRPLFSVAGVASCSPPPSGVRDAWPARHKGIGSQPGGGTPEIRRVRPRGTTRRSPDSSPSAQWVGHSATGQSRGPQVIRRRGRSGGRAVSESGTRDGVLSFGARVASNSSPPSGVRDAWPAQK